jgi:hypothetical protein
MAYEDYEDKSFKIDDNYFKVVIPDLDPGKDVPIQIRWQYADKTYGGWSNSKTLNVPEISRPEVSSVTTEWVGTSLKITWQKTSELANGYQIYLTNGLTTASWTRSVDKTQATQTFILSFEENKANFGGIFRTSFTGFLKSTYIDNTTDGVAFSTAAYTDAVCALSILNTDWSLVSIANGFTVAWTVNSVSYPTYQYTEVWISDAEAGTYTKEYSGVGPATIKVATLATNYVKIKHFSASGCSTSFSNVRTVSAYDPISFDATPPNNTFTLGTATVTDDSNGLFTFDKKVLFTWTENADTDTAGYRIRFRIAGSGDPYTYMSVPGKTKTSTYLYGLKGGQTYEIGVSTFDIYGNTNETQWQTYPNIVAPASTSLVPDAAITAGDMKLGYGIGGSNTQKGLYIAPDNYWYVQGNTNVSSAARLSVGGTSDKLVWDGTNLTITGTVYANAGRFTGSIDVGSSTVAGQLRVYAGSNKFEVGKLTNTSGQYIEEFGIQGTNSSGKLFQLDTINGIVTNKGTIGGWTINETTITKNQTSLGSDGSITAGSSGQFQVTTAGALTATNATILGSVKATGGGFGTFDSSFNIVKGWTIGAATLTSTGQASGTTQIILNGETGTISGGLISGTKIEGSQLGVYGSPGAGGATTGEEPNTENDSGGFGGTGTAGGSGSAVTLTIRDGEINADKSLLIKSGNTTEIYTGGSKAAAFSSTYSSLNFTTGLYVGASTSENGVQTHTSPYVSIDARMRLRRGAPLFYPGGSAGAYIRNIYIKDTDNNPSPSTGYIGDVFIAY